MQISFSNAYMEDKFDQTHVRDLEFPPSTVGVSQQKFSLIIGRCVVEGVATCPRDWEDALRGPDTFFSQKKTYIDT